jgi:hypothetical protein
MLKNEEKNPPQKNGKRKKSNKKETKGYCQLI